MRDIAPALLDKIAKSYQTIHGNAEPHLDIIVQQSTQFLEQGLMLNPCTLWVDAELTAIDIAASRQDKNAAPQELSMVYIVDGVAKLATLDATNNICRDWVYRKDLGPAVDCAIDYDGRWQRITAFDDEFYSVTSRWALVTFGEPYIALVKPDGSLTVQQGDSAPIELADTGVTRVSLMRGWKNAIIYNADQGIICAYIKSGNVMYRSYCLQPPADPALWEIERQVTEFDTSVNPATHISLFRTNDYRAGFLAEINGEIHMSVTDRNWSGMAIDDHTITATVTDLLVTLHPVTFTDLGMDDHTITATIADLLVAPLYALSDNAWESAENDGDTTVNAVLRHFLTSIDLTDFIIEDGDANTFGVNDIAVSYTFGDNPRELAMTVDDLRYSKPGDLVLKFLGTGTTRGEAGQAVTAFQITFTPTGLVYIDIDAPMVEVIYNE